MAPKIPKKTQDYMFSSGDPHKKVSFPTGRGATPTYISHGPLILWEVVPKPGDLQANDLGPDSSLKGILMDAFPKIGFYPPNHPF